MLRSEYATDISNIGKLIKMRYTESDKEFTLPPKWTERLSRKEDKLPILFADYKDNFPFVDRFDFYMEQVRLLLRFMSQHQRFIQTYLWMGTVNAWVIYVNAKCNPRLPLSQQKKYMKLRSFFKLIGEAMIAHPERFLSLA